MATRGVGDHVAPRSWDSTNSSATLKSLGHAALVKLKSKSVYETNMRLLLEGSTVDQGLSSRWLNPSLEMAATGSPQVLPPSVDLLTEIAAKGLELLSV